MTPEKGCSLFSLLCPLINSRAFLFRNILLLIGRLSREAIERWKCVFNSMLLKLTFPGQTSYVIQADCNHNACGEVIYVIFAVLGL